MAQVTDYTVSNQTFPNTRADINNIFAAIATNNSGTSAPSNQQAGQWWIDTTSSTWVLYIHDGTDDIQFATIDTSANTVNFTDSALDVVTDTTPQLGGNLDLNSNDITGTGNINITGNLTASGNLTSLGIDDNATANAITIGSDETVTIVKKLVVDTDTLYVDNTNNRVGIGTSSPDSILDITSSGTPTAIIQTSSTSGNDAILKIRGARTGAVSNNCQIIFETNDDASSGDNLGYIYAGKESASNQSHLTFGTTATDGGSATERMRIDSSGNVGIGTSSPQRNLHINQPTASSSFIQLTNTSTGSASASDGLRIGVDANSYAYIFQGENQHIAIGTNDTERMRIDSSGRIKQVGTSNGNGAVNLVGEVVGSYKCCSFERTANGGEVGSVVANVSSTSYNTSSDYRLKENVVDMTGATERLKQLQPKRFNFIADADTIVDGFLAHEVSSIVPEAITGTHNEVQVWEEGEELPDGVSVGDNKLDDAGNTIPVYQGIDQSKLVPLLVASLQEALTEIDNLKARVDTLEGN